MVNVVPSALLYCHLSTAALRPVCHRDTDQSILLIFHSPLKSRKRTARLFVIRYSVLLNTPGCSHVSRLHMWLILYSSSQMEILDAIILKTFWGL